MSRRVLLFRDTVCGDLVAQSPIHVGGLGAGLTDAEAPQTRDGLGRPVLPGTALAGALQAALGDQIDQNLWGGAPEKPLGASLVTVFDAPAEEMEVLGELRWHASIDRRTGSAATDHLFSRELVPAGTRFTFRIDVETAQTRHTEENRHEAAERLLAQVIELLTGPGLRVGASASTGLGHVLLDPASLNSRCDDLTTAAGLLAAVTKASPAVPGLADITKTATDQRSDQLRITVKWRPLGPLMSKEARVGGICDALPATVRDGDGYRLLLPGSSVKGALRSRAEFIARTAAGKSEIPVSFVAQMSDASRLPGIGALFGSAGNIAANEQGNKGALVVHDTMSEVVLPAVEWEAVYEENLDVKLAADDKQRREERAFAKAVDDLNTAIAKTNGGKRKAIWFDYAVRNAIDRWSGGVANGRLFSSLEPYVGLDDKGDAWRPIVLDLDLRRLDQTVRAKTSDPTAQPSDARDAAKASRYAALALLLLTLADLKAGWVPLGYGTTRGLGAVEVSSVTLTAPTSIPPGSLPPSLISSLTGEIDTLWPSVAEELAPHWQAELDRYQSKTDEVSTP